MEETNNAGLGDSIFVEKNSKGHNWGCTVRFKGSGDSEDSEKKMIERLGRIIQHLKVEYDGFNQNAPY